MTSPISPLRQRMIDDMKMRNMAPSTQKVYTYAIVNFAHFHHKSPEQLGLEEICEYRLPRSAPSLTKTRPGSTACCSRRQPRR